MINITLNREFFMNYSSLAYTHVYISSGTHFRALFRIYQVKWTCIFMLASSDAPDWTTYTKSLVWKATMHVVDSLTSWALFFSPINDTHLSGVYYGFNDRAQLTKKHNKLQGFTLILVGLNKTSKQEWWCHVSHNDEGEGERNTY